MPEHPQARGIALLSAVVVAVGAACWMAYDYARQPTAVTAESYVAAKAGRRHAPDFAIGGTPARCGNATVVLDEGLDDLAAAYPGVIIMNAKYLPRLPTVIGLYAFGHECGHHLHGPGEEQADCYAVMRGEAQGWLTAKGVDEICTFWKAFAGDKGHLPGPARCDLMRRCFASAQALR
jgi:hypothetical protein